MSQNQHPPQQPPPPPQGYPHYPGQYPGQQYPGQQYPYYPPQQPYYQPHPSVQIYPAPPRPQPKKTSPALVVGCVVGALFFIGVAASNSDKGSRTAESSNDRAASAAVARQDAPADDDWRVEVETAPKKRVPSLNEWFELGDFGYRIREVQVVKQVGRGYAKERASQGASYVVVSYDMENRGNETETVLTDDFLIVDPRGRSYRPSSEANVALAMSVSSKDLILSELQPGLQRKMATAFEVPDGVAAGGFTLVIPEKGFGSGTVEIPLR